MNEDPKTHARIMAFSITMMAFFGCVAFIAGEAFKERPATIADVVRTLLLIPGGLGVCIFVSQKFFK